MTRAGLILMICLVTAPHVARAQTRDAAKVPTGTGSISGSVTTDEAQPRPLRRVTVQLVAGPLQTPQQVVTDDAGRYAFLNLPEGNYTVVASRPGYVRAYYGARRAYEPPGMPVAVVDGKPLTGIDLRMARGGAITGIVRHPHGQPAPGIDIQVTRVEQINGQRRTPISALQDLAPVRTDDRGIYRAYGLAPGEYLVMLRPLPMFAMLEETRKVTPEELAWADRALAGTTTAPGTPAELPAPPIPGQAIAPATVYYPGTTRASDAATITLGPGEERSGIDLTVELMSVARVSGIVLDVDGQPIDRAQVSLASSKADPNDFIGALMQRTSAQSGADGRFTLTGVGPGDYAINVRATPRANRPAPAATPATPQELTMQMMGSMFGGGGSLWATDTVSVAGRDVTDVTLRLAKGMTVQGKIVFESTTLPPGEAFRARVMLMPHSKNASMLEMASSMMSGMSMAGVITDGTFTLNGVMPGTYLLQVVAPGLLITPGLPGGQWSLKSAMLNGRDVADTAFDVKPGEDLSGLVVTFSDRHTELSGTVTDQAGRPTGAFPIVVFSTDRTSWTLGSRRIQRSRPATNGKYSISGLPPGEYFVCAAVELSEERLYDPTFLEQLAAGSFTITLADGEKRVQDLKLGGGGQ